MTTVATAPTVTDSDAARRIAEKRATHAAAVVGPRGPASFVWGDFVTEPRTRVTGAPGLWSPLPDGQPGLRVDATTEDGVRIGGRRVDGSGVLHADSEHGPAIAEFPDGAQGVIFSYDGSRYALQVWNPQSEWAQRHAGISAFDHDPAWVVAAEIVFVDSDRTVALSHHRDPRPVEVPVVAEVRFTRDGVSHTLLATAAGVDGSEITVLFTDGTSGAESYSAGRVLRLARRGGAVVLDFNDATLLPCAFSLAWNCPIPPRENALPFRVTAGEKHAIDHEGEALL